MKSERRLILNADDFGLSSGICRAILQLFEKGAITSTTFMVAADGAVDRCRAWRVERLAGQAGVHLQLTGGRPVLSTTDVPSLVDSRTGEFRKKEAFITYDPREVEREWRAQIDIACNLLGAKPSHLDSHHGAHHVPAFAEVFIKLALEFDLPVRDRAAMREYNPEALLFGSDVVLYDWTARGQDSKALQTQIVQAIVNSSEAEVLEVVTHPGHSDDELRKISSLNDLREFDLAALLELASRNWFRLEGLQLISFSEL